VVISTSCALATVICPLFYPWMIPSRRDDADLLCDDVWITPTGRRCRSLRRQQLNATGSIAALNTSLVLSTQGNVTKNTTKTIIDLLIETSNTVAPGNSNSSQSPRNISVIESLASGIDNASSSVSDPFLDRSGLSQDIQVGRHATLKTCFLFPTVLLTFF
jgi:hypothetical protein